MSSKSAPVTISGNTVIGKQPTPAIYIYDASMHAIGHVAYQDKQGEDNHMTDLPVIIGKSGTRFTLLESVDYAEENITVPAGYRCDFASVPKLLWLWLPPLGYYAHAALLHDWLYDEHHRIQRMLGQGYYFPGSRLERSQVDAMFLRQMQRDGVGWRTRWTMYLAVRACGWIYWNKETSR